MSSRMRSSDLGALAGVTIRTLRHWHALGVLPEPPRSENGYREYRVQDLVLVLRIKRLSALGIPLERVPEVLADEGASAGSLLDQLDAELAAQIERLESRRRAITQLRETQGAPDLTPELGRFVALLKAAGYAPALVALEREQGILLAHLGGQATTRELAGMYERLGSSDILPLAVSLSERFELVGTGSGEDAEALAGDIVGLLGGLMQELMSATGTTIEDAARAGVLEEHVRESLNDEQWRVLELVSERMGLAKE